MAGKKDSTDGATQNGEAELVIAGVGGIRSSEENMPDLFWSGENMEERRDATCSAGRKSKEGRGDGPRGLPAPDKVRQLQIILYRKAKSKPCYRFWSLYGEVQRVDVLQTAWRRVKANGGTAGVDGQTINDIVEDPNSEKEWLQTVREELRTKSYRPSPVRRVQIPKAGGGERPLGIPTVKDRLVQMAVYLVLMPIFEADFHPRSFGFRPGRSAHQAVEEIREALRMGKTEVVDADLAKYFDTIPHRELMRRVARRVSDGMILKLIKAWLRAPVVEETNGGRIKTNPCGTPQGGVISPLLANIYLHPLDEAVNEKCRGPSGYKPCMVRYADDLVILCNPGEGENLKERLDCWLKHRGLVLNEQKTRVIESRENGFEFLGFAFRWQQSKKGTPYAHVEPSSRAMQGLRDRVRDLTVRSSTWKDKDRVIYEVNQVTRGWGNYFALAHYHRVFRKMNGFTANRLRQWLWRKHGNASGKYRRWPDYKLFQNHGLYELPTRVT